MGVPLPAPGIGFGPLGPRASAARPAKTNDSYNVQTWFKDCSAPGANDGTVPDASWFNHIIGNWLYAALQADVTATNDQADDTFYWKIITKLFQASLDRLPIFPEIMESGNILATTATTGQVVINAAQEWRHRGHRVINTSDTLAAARTFATVASKTYHLLATVVSGAVTYSLVDRTALGAAEADEQYDSTFDTMLIAKVVTSAGNVPTVTALINKHRLAARGELLFSAIAWDGDLVAPSALTSGTTTDLNWARRPQVSLNMMTSISTKTTSDTLGTQQLNVGNWSKSRYAFFTTYQKTETPQTGYVGYEALA